MKSIKEFDIKKIDSHDNGYLHALHDVLKLITCDCIYCKELEARIKGEQK